MFGILCGFNNTKQTLTVVFDKGMNSENNISFIDNHRRIHFVTTYSTYFAEELASTDLKYFAPLNISHNEMLKDKADAISAYRSTLELWGKERTVVITFNPKTRHKKLIRLEEKLEKIRRELLCFRRNYRDKQPHWRNFDIIVQRYHRLCEQLHIGSQYYRIEQNADASEISFRKDPYQAAKSEVIFGKNIILTDNSDLVYRGYCPGISGSMGD